LRAGAHIASFAAVVEQEWMKYIKELSGLEEFTVTAQFSFFK